jgi:hypothetical protein
MVFRNHFAATTMEYSGYKHNTTFNLNYQTGTTMNMNLHVYTRQKHKPTFEMYSQTFQLNYKLDMEIIYCLRRNYWRYQALVLRHLLQHRLRPERQDQELYHRELPGEPRLRLRLQFLH